MNAPCDTENPDDRIEHPPTTQSKPLSGLSPDHVAGSPQVIAAAKRDRVWISGCSLQVLRLERHEIGKQMIGIYAMRRANGDWFALDDRGAFRVPVFHSDSEAMQARAFNGGMLLFHPVLLDQAALKDLAPVNGNATHFWLVDHASVNLKRGQRVEHGQLAELVEGATRAGG